MSGKIRAEEGSPGGRAGTLNRKRSPIDNRNRHPAGGKTHPSSAAERNSPTGPSLPVMDSISISCRVKRKISMGRWVRF